MRKIGFLTLMFLIASGVLTLPMFADYAKYTQVHLYGNEGVFFSPYSDVKANFGKSTANVLTYSPDGSLFAIGTSIGTWLYDAHTYEPLKLFDDDEVVCVTFSPDSKLLATSVKFQRVRVYDVASSSLKYETPQHSISHNPPYKPVVFLTNTTFATVTHDGYFFVWNAEKGARTASAFPQKIPVKEHLFAKLKEILYFTDAEISFDHTSFNSVTYNRNNRTLAAAGQIFFTGWYTIPGDDGLPERHYIDGTPFSGLCLWKRTSGSFELFIDWHAYPEVGSKLTSDTIDSVLFAPGSSALATAQLFSGEVHLWNTNTGAAKAITLSTDQFDLYSMAFSPNGRTLATGQVGTGTVRLWDVATRRLKSALQTGHAGKVISLAYSPDGRTLATTGGRGITDAWMGGDNTVRFFNTSTGQQKFVLTGFTPDSYGYGNTAGAFSPDGKIIATGGTDGTVRLWDAATGKLNLEDTLTGNPDLGAIYSLAFSPDGKTLASGRGHVGGPVPLWDDGTVTLWDVATRSVKTMFTAHTSAVSSITFSPEGEIIASGDWDGAVILWETTTGTVKSKHTQHYERHRAARYKDVNNIVFRPDGRFVVSADKNGTVILQHVASGRVVGHITHSGGRWSSESVNRVSLVFSPDGETFTTADKNGTVQQHTYLWEAEFDPVQQSDGSWDPYFDDDDLESTHIAQITDTILAFSPDGKTAVCSKGDWDLFLWDTETWTLKSKVSTYGKRRGGLSIAFNSLLFSPDGSTLAAVYRTGTVSLLEVELGRLQNRILESQNDPLNNIVSAAFSPDGKIVATGNSRGTVRLWDTATGTLKSTLTDHHASVENIVFSPDGKNIATGDWDGTVIFWDATTGTVVSALRDAITIGVGVTLEDDGTTIVGATRDLNPNDYVKKIVISPDKKTVVINYGNGDVHLWNVPTRTVKRIDSKFGGSILFSPDGTTIALGNQGGISLYDVKTGTLKNIQNIRGRSILFSPDGTTIATADRSGRASFYDVASGIVKHVSLEGYTRGSLMLFSPDGNTIATVEQDSTIRLYNPVTGEVKSTLTDHHASVYKLVFSPDGRTLASASDDCTIRFWNVETGTPEAPYIGHQTGLFGDGYQTRVNMLFSPDNITLATWFWRGFKLRLWNAVRRPRVEPPHDVERVASLLNTDVNADGVVNIQDLVQVAANLGETGENPADVNGDGVVNIIDLTLVAGALGETAAAPAAHATILENLTATEVAQWLHAAQHADRTDPAFQRGVEALKHLLSLLVPKETVLLANYPNPFNPETWIPYQLAAPGDVTIEIHAIDGSLVRVLSLGHKAVGIYQTRSRAAYWDGRNNIGESVASGVYFYTLSTESTRDSVTAGDFTATRKMLIRK